VQIERLDDLPTEGLAALIAESEEGGCLSTQNPSAARLDETLGFRRHAGDARCTHLIEPRAP
jgi:hypothetical protein